MDSPNSYNKWLLQIALIVTTRFGMYPVSVVTWTCKKIVSNLDKREGLARICVGDERSFIFTRCIVLLKVNMVAAHLQYHWRFVCVFDNKLVQITSYKHW